MTLLDYKWVSWEIQLWGNKLKDIIIFNKTTIGVQKRDVCELSLFQINIGFLVKDYYIIRFDI